jgi:hypothetical protein
VNQIVPRRVRQTVPAVGLGIVLINIAVALGFVAKESDDADQDGTESAVS